jgi:hypothetical protein
MKKSILVIVFACAASFAGAQDNPVLTSAKGIPILPDSGEWALGFDAASLIRTAGNFFHHIDSTESQGTNFTSGSPVMTIYGKYCASSNKFYRTKLRIGYGSEKINYEVPDKKTVDDTIQFNETYGADERTASHLDITLSAGREFRRGKGRVQGYYGYEAFIGLGNKTVKNSFYNVLDSTMNAGSTEITTYTANVPTSDPYGPLVDANGKRITEIKYGSSFSFGLRGFVGVEYFFAAKASIGGEFGWGLGIASHGASNTETVYYEAGLNPNSSNPGGPRTETHGNPGKSSGFGLDTDNAYGAVNLFFYF